MSNQAGERKGKGLSLQTGEPRIKHERQFTKRQRRTQEVEYHGEKANTEFKLGHDSASKLQIDNIL